MCNLDKKDNSGTDLLNKTQDSQSTLNSINNYFSKVGANLANNILSRTQNNESFLSKHLNLQHINPPLNSFMLHPTSENEVRRIIFNLKNTGSSGWDGITTKFLKKGVNIIVEPVTAICNICFATGTFPLALKRSVTIPIFKSGDRDMVSNYRPISLLPSLSKILEKLMNCRLKKYLELKGFLSSNQFGFREGRSTCDALHKLTSFVANGLDNKDKVLGVFLDLAKAFDTVSVPILIAKLEYMGIRGIPLALFRDYLRDRKQSVKMNDEYSQEVDIVYGVPQGSVLGPTLFLVYINDLCDLDIDKGQIITFADDTVLLFKAKTWADINSIANKGLRRVATWLDNNLLTFNAQKTMYISFSTSSKTQPLPGIINLKVHRCVNECETSCNCCSIINTTSTKYLGVVIDQHLDWKEQAKKLSARVRKLIYIFKMLRNVCSMQTRTTVYYSLCQSIISYCLTVWGGTSKTTMLVVERAQRALLKVMSFKDYRYPTDLLYKESKVLSVRKLFIQLLIVSQHKIKPDFGPRRRMDIVYKIPKCKTRFAQTFTNYLGPSIYNKISRKLKIRDLNFRECKKIIGEFLDEMDYLEVENMLR
ncbi:hypothetical protein PYW07_008578 [Mythimna separata]|uniref:Reverse transcriptase domain-containing protein n=1 Tax=Mythimna separata TaxID=271217 RepID=A0AAD7YDF1_MYTSE|nr:hypothetical protein PYW07_008578 [Mythimna separata]